jgi:glycerol-3-phosphate dehydrogenase
LVKAVAANTAQLSRDHAIVVSETGLVTITGGKWTTYRKMAEDVVTRAAEVAGLETRRSRTHDLRLHGADSKIFGLVSKQTADLTPELVARFAREEMARTVEDVLARRTRLLVLDPAAALAAAPLVANVLSREQSRGPNWEKAQLKAFAGLAESYRAF